MAEIKDTTARGRQKLLDALERLARTLEKSPSLRQGVIVFLLTGAAEGYFVLGCSEGQVHLTEYPAALGGAGSGGGGGGGGGGEGGGGGGGSMPTFIEVRGDANTVRAILAGERDAREQFLAGGLRVQGDLQYLSDLALELGV